MIHVDRYIAFGAALFVFGLGILTWLAWRGFDRRAARRRAHGESVTITLDNTGSGYTTATPPKPIQFASTCGVPTFDTERCGLLAGHPGRHLSWPSGQPYPPDGVLAVDPPVVPPHIEITWKPHDTSAGTVADPDTWARRGLTPTDPPPLPPERLDQIDQVVGVGWVEISGRKLHRSCVADRADGRFTRVCKICADRLGMAPAGGTT